MWREGIVAHRQFSLHALLVSRLLREPRTQGGNMADEHEKSREEDEQIGRTTDETTTGAGADDRDTDDFEDEEEEDQDEEELNE
jgi:hypothetical protein